MNRCRMLLVALATALGAAAVLGSAPPARAEVHVNINIGPPPIVAAEPPDLIMVPQSRVYFVPDPQLDVFFYGGYWWSPRGDRWYRAGAYDGPWRVIGRRYVPRAVIVVPHDYRARYVRERPIPYGRWKREHDRWDRENRRSHRRWEKEREREFRERRREDRHGDDRHGEGRDH